MKDYPMSALQPYEADLMNKLRYIIISRCNG